MTNQPATPEEILQSQILTVEALVRLLEQKQLITKPELMAEIVKIKQELAAKRAGN